MAKRQSRADRLQAALDKIEEATGEIEELRDEITQWKEGLEGTNLENSAKYGELEECADSLDSAIDNIRSAADEASGVSFPGMY